MLKKELSILTRFSAPVVAVQVGMMLMGTVDVWMIGRIGPDADPIAAVALGDSWISGTFIVFMGILLGIDPIVAQAHGAADRRASGLALQQGVVLSLLLSIPMSVLWFFPAAILVATGQSPDIAAAAESYTRAQVLGAAPTLVFVVLRSYLQAREFMNTTLWVILIANLLNVFFNWVLIFGNLGFPALGVVGSGIATSLSRIGMMVTLILLIVLLRLHEGAWVPWSPRALSPRGLGGIFRRGLPVGMHLGLEVWAFVGATLLAGRLGKDQLASHTIVLRMASLSFMVPLGISQATVTRVGNLIGAGRTDDAQRSAWVALGLGGGVMCLFAVIFIVLRHWLPGQFTEDIEVQAMSASILPIAAAFQLFDGTQVVGSAILRAMGNALPAAVFNLVGYYFLALPLAWWLAFSWNNGLAGIWWALCAGLAAVAVLFVAWVWKRGPARVSRV